MERYGSYSELAQSMKQGRDFIIELRWGKTGIAVMAPHGGGIEPGTASIARAIADTDHAYYAFKGVRPANNRQLHIPSTSFDEPRAMEMIERCHTIVTIHGCKSAGRFIYVGGRDSSLKEQMAAKLIGSGYRAEMTSDIALRGEHRNNLCNRGRRGKGLQLEISESLRIYLTGRTSGHPPGALPQLLAFARTVRQGIETARTAGAMTDSVPNRSR